MTLLTLTSRVLFAACSCHTIVAQPWYQQNSHQITPLDFATEDFAQSAPDSCQKQLHVPHHSRCKSPSIPNPISPADIRTSSDSYHDNSSSSALPVQPAYNFLRKNSSYRTAQLHLQSFRLHCGPTRGDISLAWYSTEVHAAQKRHLPGMSPTHPPSSNPFFGGSRVGYIGRSHCLRKRYLPGMSPTHPTSTATSLGGPRVGYIEKSCVAFGGRVAPESMPNLGRYIVIFWASGSPIVWLMDWFG